MKGSKSTSQLCLEAIEALPPVNNQAPPQECQGSAGGHRRPGYEEETGNGGVATQNEEERQQSSAFFRSLQLQPNCVRVNSAPSTLSSPAGRDDWDDSALLQEISKWTASVDTVTSSGNAPTSASNQHNKARPKTSSLLSFDVTRHPQKQEKHCFMTLQQELSGDPGAPRPTTTSQKHFMKQFDLVNVAHIGMEVDDSVVTETLHPVPSDQAQSQATQQRWRLWNPEQDCLPSSEVVTGDGADLPVPESLLWNDVFNSIESSCLDIPINNEASDKSPPRVEESVVLLNATLFCQPCSLPLGSKDAYERHIRSQNHIKRSSVKGSEESPKPHPSPMVAKRRNKKRHRFDDFDEVPSIKKNSAMKVCESCHFPVDCSDSVIYAKHLLSHFHHTRSKSSKDRLVSKQLILRHISDIVRLAPFQCRACSYFCNWHSDFLDHWRSAEHRKANSDGNYWCSFCLCVTASSDEMLQHLQGEKHMAAVDALARHVPIIIRKLDMHQCFLCQQQFRLKFELRRHVSAYHRVSSRPMHELEFSEFTTQKVKHSKRRSVDNKRSKTHSTSRVASTTPMDITCTHCGSSVPDLNALKIHMESHHCDELSQCGSCGNLFALPQDLGAHVRTGCGIQNDGLESKAQNACGEKGCTFRCLHKGTMLFHHSLQHNPRPGLTCIICKQEFSTRSHLRSHVLIHEKSAPRCTDCYRIFMSEKALQAHRSSVHRHDTGVTLPCPKCEYVTTKSKLLALHKKRKHFTKQKCPFCTVTMSTYSGYQKHLKEHHSGSSGFTRFECSVEGCGFSALTKTELLSHAMKHQTEKRMRCAQCSFRCKRRSELTRHERVRHLSSALCFTCNYCDYTTALKTNLDRHLHKHKKESGSMHKCTFCSYITHDPEAIRKHILKTNLHPGAAVYNCQSCSFKSDSNVEFRQHLEAQHEDLFPSGREAKEAVKNHFLIRNEVLIQ